jgi:hypothetical protein
MTEPDDELEPQDDDAGRRAFEVFSSGLRPPTPTDWPDERRRVNILSDKGDSIAARIARTNLFARSGMKPPPTPAPAPPPPPPPPPAPPMPAPKTNAKRCIQAGFVYDDDPVEYALTLADGTKVSYRLALPRVRLVAFDAPPSDVPEELHAGSPYINRRRHRLVDALRAAKEPLTAEKFALDHGCTVRTIYRDILDMQLAGLPIVAAHGRGYVWKREP